MCVDWHIHRNAGETCRKIRPVVEIESVREVQVRPASTGGCQRPQIVHPGANFEGRQFGLHLPFNSGH